MRKTLRIGPIHFGHPSIHFGPAGVVFCHLGHVRGLNLN